jgi:hypothetical protein
MEESTMSQLGKLEQQDRELKPRAEVRRMGSLTIFVIVVTLIALVFLVALHAQDKYTLVSPDGIAFSDFMGYEDWADVSSARQDDIIKVIVANSKMITAFKSGVPLNGQTFPEGSMIVKLQWKLKKSTEAQFAVDVPDYFTQAFVMEKDSRRFPKSNGGWGYAVFNYDTATKKFSPDPTSHADCGNTCHTAVKGKDYIFHAYETR